MAKKKVEVVKVGGYTFVNYSKHQRAVHGSVGSKGQTFGGVGKDASEAVLLAEYDRLGGLIRTKEGYKVKMGCFWDFVGKKAHEKPEVICLFPVNGKEVEVPVGEPLPIAVQAAEIAKDEAETEAKEEEEEKEEKKAKAKKDKK